MLIELRQALIPYRDYHTLLLALAGRRELEERGRVFKQGRMRLKNEGSARTCHITLHNDTRYVLRRAGSAMYTKSEGLTSGKWVVPPPAAVLPFEQDVPFGSRMSGFQYCTQGEVAFTATLPETGARGAVAGNLSLQWDCPLARDNTHGCSASGGLQAQGKQDNESRCSLVVRVSEVAWTAAGSGGAPVKRVGTSALRDVALGKPASADREAAERGPECAVDGDTSTRWAGRGPLIVDLGGRYELESATIKWEAARPALPGSWVAFRGPPRLE